MEIKRIQLGNIFFHLPPRPAPESNAGLPPQRGSAEEKYGVFCVFPA